MFDTEILRYRNTMRFCVVICNGIRNGLSIWYICIYILYINVDFLLLIKFQAEYAVWTGDKYSQQISESE